MGTYLDVAAFDLTLYVIESGDGVTCTLEYRTDMFDASTIARMAEHFAVLVRALAMHPAERVSTLPLLTAAERGRAVIDWNATEQSYSTSVLIHELVEAQARATPDATAVLFESRDITYRALDAWSNQLAHRLQAIGVGPEVRVGVHMERSVEVVVAVLGILKAGGAYVPLDPDYPPERIAQIQADACVRLTIVHPGTRGAGDVPVLELDPAFAALATEPESTPGSAVAPDNLAYVLYTSGSTGKPKGVAVSHRAIGNRLLWGMRFHAMTAPDALLQVCAFGFDVSVWEFFTPLVSGARLVMPRPGGHRDVRYLARLMKDARVNVVCFVPALLRAFLEEPASAACTDLRQVLCGGEALTADLRDAFFSRLSCELVNFYGPTEASVDATCWSVQPESLRIPIGRPIGNVKAYVLDTALQPVPPGVLGDLYIGGAGLARGYLGAPDITAAHFLPDPFGNDGSVLYKTGDMARYLDDGNIEFAGRADDQIKLRGVRIELTEIEAVLRSHPEVKDAVVLLVG
jgi:amino acid adenylation domain-containing protein